MVVTDPIADMLTRIRNALRAKKEVVDVPASNMKKSIAEILKSEGFITDYQVAEDSVQGIIKIILKYGPKKEAVLVGMKRISKPGLRVYTNYTEMPKVLNGMGIAIISTSKGVMTDKQARQNQIGGEVLAYIW